MGAGHAKIDSATIKINVQNLKKKLDQENVVIDSYLSTQIISALDIYCEELRKTKGNEDLLTDICDVKRKLQIMPTQKGESVKYYKTDWDQQLEELEKRVKQLRICQEFDRQQRDNELKEIIKLSKKFDQASKGKQHVKVKEGRKQIPHCFLELFLYLPSSDIINNKSERDKKSNTTLFDYGIFENAVKDMKSKTEQLHEMIQNTEICVQELKKQNLILKTIGSTQNVELEENVPRSSGQSLQNNVIRLKNARTDNKSGQKNATTKMNNSDNDRTSFNKSLKVPSNYVFNEIATDKHRTEENKDKYDLWSIKNALDKLTAVDKNLQSLETYQQDRNEILILQRRLNNLTEDPTDKKMKENILRDVKERLKMLDQKISEEREVMKCMWYQNEDNLNPNKQEETNRYLQYFQTVENNIDDVTKLNLAATTKIKSLEDYKKKITDLQLLNGDINHKRTKILRKINTVIDQLKNGEDYYEKLKKIKSTVLIYKSECENFSYPQTSKTYKRKQSEIFGLLEELESIRVQFGINNSEIISMKDSIKQILKDLEKKAQDNDLSNQYLELIQKIDNEITKITKADMNDSDKLQCFNEYKKKIDSIITSDDEVLYEKQDILNKIKQQEQYLNTTSEKQTCTVSKIDKLYEKKKTGYDININNSPEGHLRKVSLEKTESSVGKYDDSEFERFIENLIYSQSSNALLERDEISDFFQELKSEFSETEVLEMTKADWDDFDKISTLSDAKQKIISMDTSNELCEINKTALEKVAHHEQETRGNHFGTSKTTSVSPKISNREQDALK